MRVVHIIDSGGYYGAEAMLVHLCQAQQAIGVDVEVISIGTLGNYEKPLEAKLRLNKIPFKSWRMKALPDPRESLKILAYAQKTKTNVIHSHGYKGNILLGIIPKRLRKVPIISTVHGYTIQKGFSKLAIYQWLDRYLLNQLDAAVLVSEGMRHQVNSEKLGPKLHIIPNGISEVTPPEADEEIPLFHPNDYKIAAIGRLSYEKNFQLLINSMPTVLKKIPHAKLVIYGIGAEKESLEIIIKKLNLTNNVFLPGYISEPTKVYRQADLFVNCSITEGMPITLLEAMREGCLFIASNIPAHDKITAGSALAKNIFSLNVNALSKKIEEMASLDKNEILQLKKEAQEMFKSNYSIIKTSSLYLKLYEHITQSK